MGLVLKSDLLTRVNVPYPGKGALKNTVGSRGPFGEGSCALIGGILLLVDSVPESSGVVSGTYFSGSVSTIPTRSKSNSKSNLALMQD